MERALSQDERIRRAEKIYARRKNLRERTSRATLNISSSSEHKNFKLFKRLALQAFICLLIYFIFYLINTTNYSFSKVTLEKTEELVSYEVDFISIYNNIAKSVTNYISSFNFGKNENSGALVEENEVSENIIESNENIQINEIETEENIEDVQETSEIKEDKNVDIALINNEEDTTQEEIKNLELSETERIKQKYSFIIPVKRVDFF